MECFHLIAKTVEIGVVEHHIVGHRQALRTVAWAAMMASTSAIDKPLRAMTR